MAVYDDDRLHAELDRQLAEVRAACDGLATRSGLLVAAISAIALLLGPRIDPARHLVLLVVTSVVLGLAMVAAGVTLGPWLSMGPDRALLVEWADTAAFEAFQGSEGSTAQGGRPRPSALYSAKVVILGGNLGRLAVMRWSFVSQAALTIVTVGLALGYTAWR